MTIKSRIDSHQRQEQILEAVSSLFAEKGLGITTKELAAAAGVSEALIYKHFKSKEELFEKVKERCCSQVHFVAEHIFAIETARERITISMLLLSYAALIGFEEDILPKPEVHKLILQSLATEGEFAQRMFENFGDWVGAISGTIDQARQDGVLAESHLSNSDLLWMAHHFVLGMALSRAPVHKVNHFEGDDKALVQSCAIQCLLMLGMSPDKARENVTDILNRLDQFDFIKRLKE